MTDQEHFVATIEVTFTQGNLELTPAEQAWGFAERLSGREPSITFIDVREVK